jgi:hypothetical protein
MEHHHRYDQIIAPHILAAHGCEDTPRGVPLTTWHDHDHEANQARLDHTHRRNDDLDPARVRGADPDHDGWTEHHLDKYGRVVPDDQLAP